jgi:CRISPR/Cas system-associated exonuclease Cas4 (RecB family)
MDENERLKYIGVKELGSLAKDDFCPRCFWYEKRFGPFPSFFPGVFNVIDRNLKSSVWLRWKKEKKLPVWLKIENVEGILTTDKIGKVEEKHGQKYLVALHKKSGLILRGAPDLILKLKDNTLHIIDFKTGKFKEEKDQFLPMYEVQLNGYAILATKMKVSQLSLVYFNPTNDIPEEIFTAENFMLSFGPKMISVEIKTGLITNLLMEAKKILESKSPPLPKENCRGTCFYIEKIIKRKNIEEAI